ncbi:MAG: DegT/DnrJ/EryC1/StrS family aminotransferase, partial [Parasporobacterium sp.]|nr:DegT/DnrJ/EryC1/StrS family aminotransferase [Parasporobacterium sp.]
HITDKTCAIVTPHIFGIPCDVDAIQELAEKHHLKVIYDGAQAFGTKVHGKSIACYGDAVMFSFHAIKIFNSIEGGMLAFRDPGLSAALAGIRNFGIDYENDDVTECGYNAKMNEFQAAMGIVNLPNLEKEVERRTIIAEYYIRRFSEIEGLNTFNYRPDIRYNFGYFPVRVKNSFGMNRDELWRRLKEAGIGTRRLYNHLTCDYSYYVGKGYGADVKHARGISEEALDFPMYGSLTEEDIDYITDTIIELQRKTYGGSIQRS